jgi:hypothetical protein
MTTPSFGVGNVLLSGGGYVAAHNCKRYKTSHHPKRRPSPEAYAEGAAFVNFNYQELNMHSLAVLVLFAFPLSAFADSGGPDVRGLGRDVIEHSGDAEKLTCRPMLPYAEFHWHRSLPLNLPRIVGDV